VGTTEFSESVMSGWCPNDERRQLSWTEYCEAVDSWKAARQSMPGEFSCSVPERMWRLNNTCPLPDLTVVPTLTLPLRIHLAKGPELGCTLTWEECFTELVPLMNSYWKQAGIEWDLVEVLPEEWTDDADGGRASIEQARRDIYSLSRDPATGMMAGKGFRRSLFLDRLIPEALQECNTYDIYMFDFVGNESQGVLQAATSVYPSSDSYRDFASFAIRLLHIS
jgi:hypothetical protein